MPNPIRLRREAVAQSLDALLRQQGAVVNPTTSAGWRLFDGGGAQLRTTSTNVCTDPQGRLANGTFWPASTAHTTITANVALPVALPADLAGDGGYVTTCLRLVNDGIADAPATANLTVTASKYYQTMLYVYAPTLGGNLTITAETGHTFTVAALTTSNSGWTKYVVKANTAAGETVLGLKFAFATGTGSTVYVTACRPVNENNFCTGYFDGSYHDCSWTGTAFLSTSTRATTDVRWTTGVPAHCCCGRIPERPQALDPLNSR